MLVFKQEIECVVSWVFEKKQTLSPSSCVSGDDPELELKVDLKTGVCNVIIPKWFREAGLHSNTAPRRYKFWFQLKKDGDILFTAEGKGQSPIKVQLIPLLDALRAGVETVVVGMEQERPEA